MDFEVVRLINSIFSSNTYCISDIKSNEVILVDVGDVIPILEFLKNTKSVLHKVFLTHAHFDHIYGLNDLLKVWPDIVIYTSVYGKESLYSDRLNYSRYHETPFIFKGDNVVELNERSQIFIGNTLLKIIETPGHDPGCLSYKLGNYLFTGDSFIPKIETVTNLRGGNKKDNQISLEKLKKEFSLNTIICPGHGDMVNSKDVVNEI